MVREIDVGSLVLLVRKASRKDEIDRVGTENVKNDMRSRRVPAPPNVPQKIVLSTRVVRSS